jgi:phosphoribosylamine--glycine ligase
MRVLLVGGGGREHALAWRLTQDDRTVSIIAAPGNPGIAELAECVPVSSTDVDGLLALAQSRRVDMTIVGPEAPLAAGIVDRFRAAKLAVFGPTQAAAEIETSKAFAKVLMREANVPTARAIMATEPDRAKGAAHALGLPIVIKASGLAAGKGVLVCNTFAEAERAIDDMLVGHAFGVAGQEVLVEEFMSGEELSVLAITDGTTVIPLVPAQDHKRLLAGDRGPNTGGMGAYAPVALATDALMRDVVDHIFAPTLAAMAERDRAFTGLLYAGLMLTVEGPKVVEFNCRFGDPETQAVLPVARLSASFTELLAAVARGDKLPQSLRCPRLSCRDGPGRGRTPRDRGRPGAGGDGSGADLRGRAAPQPRGGGADPVRRQTVSRRHRVSGAFATCRSFLKSRRSLATSRSASRAAASSPSRCPSQTSCVSSARACWRGGPPARPSCDPGGAPSS